MPDRSGAQNIQSLFSGILERLRAVERMRFEQELTHIHDAQPSAYSWQSSFTLTTGYGHRLCADRNGSLLFMRGERSEGDGTTEAVMDVSLNGQSLTLYAPRVTVPAGEILGPEVVPDFGTPSTVSGLSAADAWDYLPRFRRGDYFQVQILNTGGGSGPLRCTLFYATHPPALPTRTNEDMQSE